MWPMILGGHSGLHVGDRKSSVTYSRQSADRLTRRLVPTERSDRRLSMSATRMIWSKYPCASPWTTLYVNTAIVNSIPSGTRSQWRQSGASKM